METGTRYPRFRVTHQGRAVIVEGSGGSLAERAEAAVEAMRRGAGGHDSDAQAAGKWREEFLRLARLGSK